MTQDPLSLITTLELVSYRTSVAEFRGNPSQNGKNDVIYSQLNGTVRFFICTLFAATILVLEQKQTDDEEPRGTKKWKSVSLCLDQSSSRWNAFALLSLFRYPALLVYSASLHCSISTFVVANRKGKHGAQSI